MDVSRKALTVKVIKGISSDPRVLRFVASTEDIDRDGDVIDVAGWNLEEWNKNSVIMWSHDYSLPPIAKGVRAEKDIRNKQLLIDARFPTLAELAPDGNPSEHAKFIETIYQLYANDILHAVSVGCSYDKIDEHKELDSRYSECRYHVLQETLMELSCCSIGANPSALRAASATPGIEKSVLDMVVKSMGIEEVIEPAKPEVKNKVAIVAETKIGARLSAATLAQIDELEGCKKELDEAFEACKSASDKMATMIKMLRDGASAEEPGEPVEEPDGDEGTEKAFVFHIVR
jgi:hypothetical protein